LDRINRIGGGGRRRAEEVGSTAVFEESLDGGFGDGARGIELGGGALGAGVDGEAVVEMPGGELIELIGGEAGDAGDGTVFEGGAVGCGGVRTAADGALGMFGRAASGGGVVRDGGWVGIGGGLGGRLAEV